MVGNLGKERVSLWYPLLGAMTGAGIGYAFLMTGGGIADAIVAGFAAVPVGATVGATLGRRYD